MECRCLSCYFEFEGEPDLADEELGLTCPKCGSALVEFLERKAYKRKKP